MPPATDASKRKFTPLAFASAKSSNPCSATSCLFAVTTCLPAFSARVTTSSATEQPPIVNKIDLRILFDLGKIRHKIGRERAVRLFRPGEDGLEPNLLARVFFYHRGVIDQKIGHTAADHTKAGNCDLLHWILLLVVRHRENLAQRLMV